MTLGRLQPAGFIWSQGMVLWMCLTLFGKQCQTLCICRSQRPPAPRCSYSLLAFIVNAKVLYILPTSFLYSSSLCVKCVSGFLLHILWARFRMSVRVRCVVIQKSKSSAVHATRVGFTSIRTSLQNALAFSCAKVSWSCFRYCHAHTLNRLDVWRVIYGPVPHTTLYAAIIAGQFHKQITQLLSDRKCDPYASASPLAPAHFAYELGHNEAMVDTPTEAYLNYRSIHRALMSRGVCPCLPWPNLLRVKTNSCR